MEDVKDVRTVWKTEVVMASRPQGMPTEANFEVRRSQLELQSSPPPGLLSLQVLWISVDPYIREIMNEGQPISALPALQVGQSLNVRSICKVLASGDPEFKEGDIVQSFTPIADYAQVPSNHFSIRKIEHKAAGIPLNYHLGVLGMPGQTAWVGVNVITQLKAKEEVFISAAAGAVGLLAGQLAKLKGCRVVGSAGTDEKVKMLKDLYRFDEAFNYRTEKDLNQALKKYFPNGFDVYFENVGGQMLEAALENIRVKGRIVACGMISQYNKNHKDRYGVQNLMHIVGKSLKIEGYLIGDYSHVWGEFSKEVSELLEQGKIHYHTDILGRGIEQFPKAFSGLLSGENTGKAVLFINDCEE